MPTSERPSYDVLIIGGGPAGLTAAYWLTKNTRLKICLVEADPQYFGGISRTVNYKNYLFDIGGHRFFSKSAEVNALWQEILDEGFMVRSRISRIYYKNKFYSYPFKAVQAFTNLGLLESLRCGLSYVQYRIWPIRQVKSFRHWVTNRFGKRLFEIFFKTYTEKVWGMSCDEISADWAAQRIKGLNLSRALIAAIRSSLGLSRGKGKVIKTLIEEFHYPRRGPGMMWHAAADKIIAQGGEILQGQFVSGLEHHHKEGDWSATMQSVQGVTSTIMARQVISTAPIAQILPTIKPLPQSAPKAQKLRYRDFLVVALILDHAPDFPDNWIYVHEPDVKVGRIQNFGAWSPEMIPESGRGCLGMEYFCFEGDGLWSRPDADLIAQARQEVVRLGLIKPEEILDGCVVRQPKAYPVYDDQYRDNIESIRTDLAANLPTLHLVGRNGMHKYNNQDHAMMTGLLAAKNIAAGQQLYDVWGVNEDAEYSEEILSSTQSDAASGIRNVPTKIEA